MQYLKEEVRKKIIDTAKNEFYELGFKEANMRNIALKAGITAGNIYRYFPSKIELFEAIIDPVMDKVSKLVMLESFISFDDINDVKSVGKLIHAAVRVCAEYTKEIVIIIDKSQGTKYENSYQYLKKLISSSIDKSLAEPDMELSEALAVSLIAGLLYVFTENIDNHEGIVDLATRYIYYSFSGNYKKNE